MASGAQVFYADTGQIDYERLLASWRPRLFPAELDRLRNLRFERDRRDYLGAHVLERIASRAGVGASSLTHTAGFAAIAFSGSAGVAIGLDAEGTDSARRLESMTELFLSAKELRWIDQAPVLRKLRLVHLWTVKEAVLKAHGIGIAAAGGYEVMRSLECSLEEPVDDWAIIAVRDVRTGVVGRGWGRTLGEHVLAVVTIPDLGMPQLRRTRLT